MIVLVFLLVDVIVTLFFLAREIEESESHFLLARFIFNSCVIAVVGTEVLCRMFYLGATFAHSAFNLIEFGLIPMSIVELTLHTNQNVVKWPLLRSLRFLHVILTAFRGFGRLKRFREDVQSHVHGNRMRFREDGFNLDLVYVTAQLIAMGRPGVGADALYNNPASGSLDSSTSSTGTCICW